MLLGGPVFVAVVLVGLNQGQYFVANDTFDAGYAMLRVGLGSRWLA